ncbi:MAG: class I SAM-dependent methyltransferase [Emcibacter sp.]|nr:class I SAM-dependent methyltransferase [Emcibacter sp.]
MNISKTIAVICAASIIAGTMATNVLAKTLDEVIAGDQRSDKNKARDKYRHPKETLEFFGLTADMTVVEIWPGGGGWYQEILAPYLNDKGKYYSAGYDLSSTKEYTIKNNKKIAERFASDVSLYGNATTTELVPPEKVTMAPAGSVDMVVSFRNFHNWQMGGTEREVLKAVYDALKPGGIFGITDHRSDDPVEKDGYIKPSYLLEVAQEAGFILVAKSEINANPKDNHHHVKGVWTLPPRLAGDKADHDKMRAIGESDRLTFKFMKSVK